VTTGKGASGCRTIIGQLCKYCVAAGTGTIIDFVLYTTLVLITPIHYLLANAASFTTGAIVVYYLQKNWTFQYQGDRDAWIFAKFVSLVIFSYGMSNIVLFILVGILLQNPILSKGIQIVIGAGWGYLISRYFVYK
jgi:putative flippase GtrA